MVDLFVQLMEHERCLVVVGVRASDGSQRFPPGVGRQLLEKALPESVGTLQGSDGLRRGRRCQIGSLEPGGLSLDSQPLRIADSSVALDDVPQPPGDRREGP
jgi:hypothetical protein